MAKDDDKDHKPTRRAMLKAIAATTAVIALPKIASAQAKTSKQAAQYQDKPKNGQECDTCRFYVPGKKMGTCQLVEGSISPKGWCQFYVKK